MKIEINPLKQETDYTCLPTCIRTIINYFGTNIPENEIAAACHTSKTGTRLRDAINAIRSLGYEITQIQDGTLEELFQSINDQTQ
ncbi:cysteine peptidase family C39 domain-containing protein [candidate division KSB1 bacterium]|nr:cysteine peptidase family C39 domain-containing protein [candidate division KSB1 bacterium]